VSDSRLADLATPGLLDLAFARAMRPLIAEIQSANVVGLEAIASACVRPHLVSAEAGLALKDRLISYLSILHPP